MKTAVLRSLDAAQENVVHRASSFELPRSCVGVLLCFLGSCLVAFQTPTDASTWAVHSTYTGEALALLAAALFSLCSVLLEHQSGRDFDPGLFLGLNGMVALAGAPLVLALASQWGLEPLRLPDLHVLMVLLLNASFGCLFANYLYSCALLRLGPTVANSALSLSIPLSAAVDAVILQEHRFSMWWLLGASFTTSGVVLCALDLDPPHAGPGPRGWSDPETAEPEELQSLGASEGALSRLEKFMDNDGVQKSLKAKSDALAMPTLATPAASPDRSGAYDRGLLPFGAAVPRGESAGELSRGRRKHTRRGSGVGVGYGDPDRLLRWRRQGFRGGEQRVRAASKELHPGGPTAPAEQACCDQCRGGAGLQLCAGRLGLTGGFS
eukprot:g13778.t2